MQPLIFQLAVKIASLAVIHFILFAVVAAVLIPQAESTGPAQASAAVSLLVVCILQTAVLAYVIVRSRWGGWRLTVAIFVVLYGTMTVMPQIESAIFISVLPPGFLPRLFLMGAIIAAILSPLAVLILGKRNDGQSQQPHGRFPVKGVRYLFSARSLVMPMREWAWKLSLIAVVYVGLYFSFGYYVAWQVPEVRAYYGATDPTGFIGQMQSVFEQTPWLPAFQVLRAMMWTALALPVIRMMKGAWWEAGLAVALLFSVVMAQLLMPNPYMPEAVRMAHLVETASSNFIFGWFIVWLLHRHHSSFGDLFKRRSIARV